MPEAADIDSAVRWLTAWHPNGPWVIVEIDPNTENPTVRAREFHYDGDEEFVALRAYIESRCGYVNLYFVPNRTVPGVTTTPRKDQISYSKAIYVDLDLPRGQEPNEANFAILLARIRALTPSPTVIIFSGGGYQAYWLFPEDLLASEYLDRVEAVGKTLARELRSDAVQNVNRLMRLPGTLNIPNAAKRARGRIPQLAFVVESDWSRTWSFAVDPIPRLPEDYYADDDDTDDDDHPRTHGRLFGDLPTKWQKLVRSGDPEAYGGDRSRLVFALVTSLVRKGWRDEEILPFIYDEEYGTSAHCRAQADPLTSARRQLERARRSVAVSWDWTPQGGIDRGSPKNVMMAFSKLGVKFSHDSFADQSYVNGIGPLRFLDDPVEVEIRIKTHETFGFYPPREITTDVTTTLARAASYHPVLDYLSSLSHDGEPRIERWLIDHAGAPDTPYVRAVSRLILVAAVRRVRQPGSKFDEMLVLISPKQGTNKSSSIAALSVREEWFTDSFPLRTTEQRVIESLAGKWIVECAELRGIHHADVEAVKNLMSRQYDHARLAYGHHPVRMPRQCVFFGTTNSTAFLRDRENRRFWPVTIVAMDLAAIVRVRDQLWAEAAAEEARGASIRLDPSLWEAAAVVQEDARYGDAWTDILGTRLAGLTGRLASSDVWKMIGRPDGQVLATDNGRLTEVMAEIGWERKVARIGGAPVRCFVRGATGEERSVAILVHRDPVTNEIRVERAENDTPF